MAILQAGAVDISARVFRNFSQSIQSIPNATITALSFENERWDTDAIHDTVTNNSRLTAKTAGKYLIFGHVRWEERAPATGGRFVRILLNGTTPLATTATPVTTIDGNFQNQSVATHYDLAVNDYVELVVYQTSGGPLVINVQANDSLEFGMVKLP